MWRKYTAKSLGFCAALFALFLFVGATPASAAVRTASVSGNWSNTATWGGNPVPTSADSVVINTGINVVVDTTTASVTSITLNAPAANNGITISSTYTLNTSGAITMNSPSAGTITQTINVGAGTLNAASIAIPGSGTAGRYCTLTLSTGTVNVTGNITFSGTAAQARLTFTGAGTLNIGGTISGSGTFAASAGTVNYNGAAQTVAGLTYNNLTLSGSLAKTFTNASTINGILSMEGTATVTYTTVPTMGAASTLQYNKTGSFTAGSEWQTTLAGNLVVTSTGAITSPGAGTLVVSGTLTVGSGASLTVLRPLTVTGNTYIHGTTIWSSSSGTSRLMTFNNDVVLYSGSSWIEDATTSMDTFAFAGNFSNSAAIFAGNSTGAHLFSGTSKTISGSTTTTIPSVTINGTITNNGVLNVTTALAGSGTLTNWSSGLLNVNFTGAMGLSTLDASTAGNTVSYGYAGTQTLKATTYSNLILAGTSAKTMTGVSTINGNFTFTGSATAAAATGMTIGGNVTIGSGTTFTAGSYTHNVAGNWANNGGTFTSTGSTINFSKSGAQSIDGSSPSSFNNLTLSGSGNKSFSAGVTIAGTMAVSGSAVADLVGTTSTANALTLGGVAKTAGTWGSSGSTATNQDDTYFLSSSNGYVTIATGPTAGTWIGGTSSDWDTAANWFGGSVPNSATDVIIPTGTPYAPVVGSADQAHSITINSTAILTISGSNSLTVPGNWSNAGVFVANSGTVNLDGETIISGAGTGNFYNLSLSSASTTLGVAKTISHDLTIDSGSKLNTGGFALAVTNLATIDNGGTLITSGTGTVTAGTLDINGTYNNGSTGAMTITNLAVGATGVYNHNSTAVALILGSSSSVWDSASNCNITGAFTSATNITNFIGQTFGNFTYNAPGQTNTVSLVNATGTTTVQGNFTVSSTGSNTLFMRITGQIFAGTINIDGNFIMAGGTFNMHNGGATANAQTINLAGNFIMTGGNLTENTATAGSRTVFNFSKSGTQTFTKTGGTITSGVTVGPGMQFNVLSGSTLDMGTNVMDGTNQTTFTLNSGAGIITAIPAGLTTSGASGSIQVSATRTYSAAANYTYNGAGAQATGNGLPTAALTGTLEVSGTSLLTATNNITLNGGNLIIQPGTELNMGTNQLLGTITTLTNGGTVRTQNNTNPPIPNGYTWGGTVILDRSAGQQYVATGTYNNLTFGHSSNHTWTNGDFTVNGALTTVAGGTLELANSLLLGSPTSITNNGIITTYNISALPIPSGKTWGGTIIYNNSGNQTIVTGTYNNLTIDQGTPTNHATLGGDLTVSGVLDLTNGYVTTGADTLYIDSTGSVTRNTGYINGNLKKYITTGGTSRTFEVGDTTDYTPVDVSFGNVTGAGDLTVKTTAGDHSSIGSSSIDPTKSVNRFWTATNSGITFDNYGAVLNFSGTDVDGGANTSNFVVGKYDTGVWTYPTVGIKNATNTQVTGLTGFSDFQIGEISDPDAADVATAKAALSAASPMTATEGVDISAVTMAQAIVNGAVSGVTVSMNSSGNTHVDGTTGAITYDASSENNNVTFDLVKNAANDSQIVDFHVPAHILTDAEEVANAKAALSAASPMTATEGVDTSAVTMAQAIVNGASTGVTVSMNSSGNTHVDGTTGAITYDTSAENNNVTFDLVKNAANDSQIVDFHVPSDPDLIDVTTAQTALATAATLNPVEGVDTNVVTMAQSIVDGAVSGVTVSMNASANARVNAVTGVITYAAATTGNVTFNLDKAAASLTQVMSAVVPAHILTDAEEVANAKAALSAASPMTATEGVDTSAVTMAQAIADGAASGVTVSMNSSGNTHVDGTTGAITYDASSENNNVTFDLVKNAANDSQIVDFHVPAHILTDAEEVANAKAALSAASPMTATEGVDTSAVTMAQAIVNGASTGVTVSMNSSGNTHVDGTTGAITYDSSAENNNVTFHLVKNAANDNQIVDFHVPLDPDAADISAAVAALSAASPMTATEGVDTSAVTMAQAIVDGAVSGVTVSMNSSGNTHVDGTTGAITYDASSENNNVTFHVVKNLANDDQVVDFHVPAHILTDAEEVANAKAALSIASPMTATEGVDTSAVIMAQAIADGAASGVTVSMNSSVNTHVDGTTGAITYDASSETNNVTFDLVKNAANDSQVVSFHVPAHVLTDAEEVANAKAALSAASPMTATEGVDTSAVTMAQAIVDSASTGVTVSMNSSGNTHVDGTTGAITYDTSAENNNVTFHLVKNAASDDQIVDFHVPLDPDAADISAATAALSAASPMTATEGVDTSAVTMAQAIVDGAVSGVTVSMNSSANAQVDGTTGAITYGPADNSNVTFHLVKNLATGNQIVSFHVPAHILTDAEQVANAKNALSLASPMSATEGVDTNAVTMAQAIVDGAATGVTVSMNSSANAQVDGTTGAITYGPADNSNVTFHLVKNAATDNQIVSFHVPAHTLTDAEQVANAKGALTGHTFHPVEGVDTSAVTMAQAVVNASSTGVTVTASSSANSRINGSTGAITYGSAVTANVTFTLTKNAAVDYQASSFDVPASALKAITAFSFSSPAATGVINESAKTVTLSVPFGTDLTALVPTITITGVSVNPAAGVAHTFVNGVASTYTVTAADLSTQDYAVTVNVASSNGGSAMPVTVVQGGAGSPGAAGSSTTTNNNQPSGLSASCPAVLPGDMIKVIGKPAIYLLNSNFEVLFFPTGDEFKSWRPTYGGYVNISQECFDSLKLPVAYPGSVNFHPGSYVVKKASSNQLYVVEPNNALAKITPALAKALYGTSYKVMTIADIFWPHYVNRGADVTTAIAHPGMLVKVSGITYYVDSSSILHEVTAAGMTANGFQTKFVRSLSGSAIAGLTMGTKIETLIPALVDKTQQSSW